MTRRLLLLILLVALTACTAVTPTADETPASLPTLEPAPMTPIR